MKFVSCPTGQFRKDVRLLKKRGCDIEKLTVILRLLENDEPLPARCRPHRLSGDWSGFWECHIGPDWLLIYRIDADILILTRTGSHSDVF